jgi:hypothetical protein
MKLKLTFKVLVALSLCGSALAAQPFLVPTNPAPTVTLSWTTPPPVTNGNPIASYNQYYGVGSRQYTNKITNIGSTNTTWTVPTRGDKYYIAVTATDTKGLEGPFSNEINYTATPPPGAPGALPAVVVTAQTAPTPTGPWADEPQLAFNLAPNKAQDYIRLRAELEPVQPPLGPFKESVRPALTAPPMPAPR